MSSRRQTEARLNKIKSSTVAVQMPTHVSMGALRVWGFDRLRANLVFRLRDVLNFLNPDDLAEHVAIADVLSADNVDFLLGGDRFRCLGYNRGFRGRLFGYRTLGGRRLGDRRR